MVLGKFVRTASGYREIISNDHPVFKPEANRYFLYISYACPWANRCLAMLKLKGLDHIIDVAVVHPTWQKTKPDNVEDKHFGWVFFDSTDSNAIPLKNGNGCGSFAPSACTVDPINHVRSVRDLYELSADKIGKFSVPVLWDTKTRQIVNNESSEILRMFNANFQPWAKGPFANHDFYPENLRSKVDGLNEWIYTGINDGVYKCGFAKAQAAYDKAVVELYESLDRVEAILATNRYLAGETFTEADIRLFMTLVRFDEVYVVYFKCNVKRMIDYPNIRDYLREIYQIPQMTQSINMEHIKMHYFT